jgi:hypothetical protein
MRPVDIGRDAAHLLRVTGNGRVLAVFARALYLQVPGGLVAVTTADAPRGPLHIRVNALPAVRPGQPVLVDAAALRIGPEAYALDAPRWSPRLPTAAALLLAREAARRWLPDRGPALDLGSAEPADLPAVTLGALRRTVLADVAAALGGRGPGLTPTGDDVLAGVLLVAFALHSDAPRALLRCARWAPTNDVARAFLTCAARGRCIEPAHDLLAGLAAADRPAVTSALARLRRFGSSSGAALMELSSASDRSSRGPAPGGQHPPELDTAHDPARIVNDQVG